MPDEDLSQLLSSFEDASYEEQEMYPKVLKTFHKHLMSTGRSENTAKSYMRTFSQLLSEDGKTLKSMASWDYHKAMKGTMRNKRGNGQTAASIKCFIDFWEHTGCKLWNGEGEWEALTDKDKIYTVKDRPRGTPSGKPPGGPGDAAVANSSAAPVEQGSKAAADPPEKSGEAAADPPEKSGEEAPITPPAAASDVPVTPPRAGDAQETAAPSSPAAAAPAEDATAAKEPPPKRLRESPTDEAAAPESAAGDSDFVKVEGRHPDKSLANRINGLYKRIGEGKLTYERVGQKKPTFLFFDADKGTWKIAAEVGAKGDFARCRDRAERPWMVQTPWKVFEQDEKEHVEDPEVKVLQADASEAPEVGKPRKAKTAADCLGEVHSAIDAVMQINPNKMGGAGLWNEKVDQLTSSIKRLLDPADLPYGDMCIQLMRKNMKSNSALSWSPYMMCLMRFIGHMSAFDQYLERATRAKSGATVYEKLDDAENDVSAGLGLSPGASADASGKAAESGSKAPKKQAEDKPEEDQSKDPKADNGTEDKSKDEKPRDEQTKVETSTDGQPKEDPSTEVKSKDDKSKEEPPKESAPEEASLVPGIPEDAPPSSEAWSRILWAKTARSYYWQVRRDGELFRVQVTLVSVSENQDAAKRIARLLWVRAIDEGHSKDEALAYRAELLARFKEANGNPAASPAVKEEATAKPEAGTAETSVKLDDISSTLDLIMVVNTNRAGGRDEWFSHVDTLADQTRQFCDEARHKQIASYIAVMKTSFKSNTTITWKPYMLCAMRCLGLTHQLDMYADKSRRADIWEKIEEAEALASEQGGEPGTNASKGNVSENGKKEAAANGADGHSAAGEAVDGKEKDKKEKKEKKDKKEKEKEVEKEKEKGNKKDKDKKEKEKEPEDKVPLGSPVPAPEHCNPDVDPADLSDHGDEWQDDLPPSHHAWNRLQKDGAKSRYQIGVLVNGQLQRMQLSVQSAGGNDEDCQRIMRLCFVRLESGASQPNTMKYRDKLLNQMANAKGITLSNLVVRKARKRAKNAGEADEDGDGSDAGKPAKADRPKKGKRRRKDGEEQEADDSAEVKTEVKKEEDDEDVKMKVEPKEEVAGENEGKSENSDDDDDDSSDSSEAASSSSSDDSDSDAEKGPATAKGDAPAPEKADGAPKPPERKQTTLGRVAAKMSVRSGLRCYCHYARICPEGSGSAAARQPTPPPASNRR